MKLNKVKEIFDVKYGVNLELSNIRQDENGIPFISRTEKNNGLSAKVKLINNINPNPKNTISVAAGGSVMSSFLQKEPYYSGRDLYYLKPKIKLTDKELFYYCMCLRANKYRYSYGRQANKTLADINIPAIDSIPDWVNTVILKKPSKMPILSTVIRLNSGDWDYFNLSDYFIMNAGKHYPKKSYAQGDTPLVTASNQNNGILNFTNLTPVYNYEHITIGKIGASAFFHNMPFCASSDVTVLTPKHLRLSPFIGLFISTLINKESFRWSYGRQIRLGDCNKLRIKLPTNKEGKPDWQFMEQYIKSLFYSKSL